MNKTWIMAAALFSGAFLGSMVSGCPRAAKANGSDNPGTKMTVPCNVMANPSGSEAVVMAVASFPGVSAEELHASVWLDGRSLEAAYFASHPDAGLFTIAGTSYWFPYLVPLDQYGFGVPMGLATSVFYVADGSVAVKCGVQGQSTPIPSSVVLYVR
jgi:hypothetical protein